MPPPPPPPSSRPPNSQAPPPQQQPPSRTYMVSTGEQGNGISQPIVSQYAMSTHERRGLMMSPDRRNFMHSMNFEAAHRVVGQSVPPDVSRRFAYTFAHEHYDPVKKLPRGKLNWLRGEGVPPPPQPIDDRPASRSAARYEYPEEYEHRPRPSSRSRTHHRERDEYDEDYRRPSRDDERERFSRREYRGEEVHDRTYVERDDVRTAPRGPSRGRNGTPPPSEHDRRGTPTYTTRDDRPLRRADDRYVEKDRHRADDDGPKSYERGGLATSSSRARYEERSSRHEDRARDERRTESSRARSPRAGAI